MVFCPACEADMDLDEELLQEGGVVSCGGCGARCEVVNVHPLEIERLNAGGDDEDFDDDDDDLDEEDDEEDDEDYDDDDDDLDDADDEDE
ncbi:MAG: hypothetical protein ACRELF_13180 [Gemmataceae bacterium]